MNIIDFLKEQKKWTVSKYKLWKAYHSDYEEYNHWQYHNPNVKTQNALEAKILRQTHVIEKGMSLSHPREKFGVQKRWNFWTLLMNSLNADMTLKIVFLF